VRVFITGIAGFLGSHLAERLMAMDHDVVGCDSLLVRILPVRLP
jgi:UDP-glucose 4-epimerase